MAWSLDSLGKKSFLSHACYRVAVRINVEDLVPRIYTNNTYNEAFWKSFVEGELFHDARRHVILEFSETILHNVELHHALIGCLDYFEQFNSLADTKNHNIMKFFITCKIELGSGLIDGFQRNMLLSSIQRKAGVIIVDISEKNPHRKNVKRTFHNVVEIFPAIYQHYQKKGTAPNSQYMLLKDKELLVNSSDEIPAQPNKKALLGFSGFLDHDHLDAFLLQALPHLDITLIMLDDIRAPNVKSMTIDLIHSFGLECFAHLQLEDVIESHQSYNLQIYDGLSSMYEISSRLFFLKCLLQLGVVISLPSLDPVSDLPTKELMNKEFKRLCHQFVDRKAFVSAVRVITLQISPEDLEKFIHLSEEVEMERFQQQEKYWKNQPSPPQLNFDKDRLLY